MGTHDEAAGISSVRNTVKRGNVAYDHGPDADRSASEPDSSSQILMMPQFTTTRRVEFAHTDMAGIVHFANYYRWMEEAEHDYFRSVGVPIMSKPVGETMAEETVVGWPRVSAQCSFEAPAYHEDILTIHLNVQRIGYKSLTFDVEFFRDEQRLAKGRMKTACCRCKRDGSLESVPIPDAYLEVIKEYAGD